jgi:hypothetical protein
MSRGFAAAQLTRELVAGEQLRWSGQPLAGVRFQAADVLLVPFSLLWGGFAIFWEAEAVLHGAPLLFQLWGIPFVCVGLYLILGRFFYDAWRRSHTVYGFTDQRVLIVVVGARRAVTSLRLKTLPDLSLSESRDGMGSISFGGGAISGLLSGELRGWPGASRRAGPRFELLPQVRSVYEAIQAVQRTAP